MGDLVLHFVGCTYLGLVTRTVIWIRGNHPYHFRSGEWAFLLETTIVQPPGNEPRPCFLVQFPDGVIDLWAIYDESQAYEFSTTAPASEEVVDWHPDVDDLSVEPVVGVALMTGQEWRDSVRRALQRLNLTYLDLAQQAARQDFVSTEARKLWLAIKPVDNE